MTLPEEWSEYGVVMWSRAETTAIHRLAYVCGFEEEMDEGETEKRNVQFFERNVSLTQNRNV